LTNDVSIVEREGDPRAAWPKATKLAGVPKFLMAGMTLPGLGLLVIHGLGGGVSPGGEAGLGILVMASAAGLAVGSVVVHRLLVAALRSPWRISWPWWVMDQSVAVKVATQLESHRIGPQRTRKWVLVLGRGGLQWLLVVAVGWGALLCG
jgi:hypothetical protein